MNTHPFDALVLENGAKLIFTPCPGTKEADLADSVATLKAAGASNIISLMFDKELAENNAASLADVCESQQVNWFQLPIADDKGPDHHFEKAWQQSRSQFVDVINRGDAIAVHCKGGSGRTGLVIGLILLAAGWPADEVVSAVQEIRPKALKNVTQRNYFDSMAALS